MTPRPPAPGMSRCAFVLSLSAAAPSPGLGRGVFPTVGTGNPRLTIAALTLRAVDAITRTLAR